MMNDEDKKEINKAIDFCKKAHDGLLRKYTEDPYYLHCINVYNYINDYVIDYSFFDNKDIRFDNKDIRIAALLHDVLEDTKITVGHIEYEFGAPIASLVEDLTDVYTHNNFPKMNRMERKEREAVRLGKKSIEVRLIKYFDLYDNLRSILLHDPSFSCVFLKEASLLMNKIIDKQLISIVSNNKKYKHSSMCRYESLLIDGHITYL